MENIGNPQTPREKDLKFTKYWNIYIDDVFQRENFKSSHLQQLTILCQLHTEYDELTNIIKSEGYTYVTESRNGRQVKINTNVTIREKVTAEIRAYLKLLNIVPEKDKVLTISAEIADEWG